MKADELAGVADTPAMKSPNMAEAIANQTLLTSVSIAMQNAVSAQQNTHVIAMAVVAKCAAQLLSAGSPNQMEQPITELLDRLPSRSTRTNQ